MKPTPMHAYASITTARVMPPAAPTKPAAPVMSMAQFAAQENAAMRKTCGLSSAAVEMHYDAVSRARVDRFMAIRDLMAKTPMNCADIAAVWGLDAGGIGRQIKQMQDGGLIRRIMVPGRAHYELTPTATALWAKSKGAK